jgi:DNA-binding NtrC family response regulator
MHKYLGVTVSEIESDISDKLKKSPLLEFEVNAHLPFKTAKKLFKKQYIGRLLQLHFGNVAEVARLSGVDRRSIHRLISGLKVEIAKYRYLKPEYVRQTAVQNIIESALETYKTALNREKFENLYRNATVLSKDIAKELPESPMTMKDAEREWERRYFETVLAQNKWNISATARKIGLRFETLHRKMKQLEIQRK